jgi:hypothetical protein
MKPSSDPLPGAPDPWVASKMPPRRRQAPYHMTDMIQAEPALAARIATRLAIADGQAARLAAEVKRASTMTMTVMVRGAGQQEVTFDVAGLKWSG